MAWVFRTNASRKEKAFTLVILGWFVLSIYGMTNSFVTEPHLRVVAAYAAVPLALAFFIPVVLDRHPSDRIRSFGVLKRSFMYLVLISFAYGIAWAGLALGVTSLGTVFFGEQFVSEFKVVSKSDGRSRRSACDHSLRLEEVRSNWKTKLCVKEEFWATVRQGDLLQAQGKRSPLGSLLEKVWRREG
jgi:drug/metabolite transporter superfamily protein YnfA